MSNSPTKPAATAAKTGAGTSDNVAEAKGASTPAAHKTSESSTEKAPVADAKAVVSDTKSAETDTKTVNTDAKLADSNTKTADVVEKAKDLIDSALDAAATGAEATVPGEMVNIKMLRSHPRLGYAAGDQGSIPRTLYDELLADGPFFEEI